MNDILTKDMNLTNTTYNLHKFNELKFGLADLNRVEDIMRCAALYSTGTTNSTVRTTNISQNFNTDEDDTGLIETAEGLHMQSYQTFALLSAGEKVKSDDSELMWVINNNV